MTDCRERAFPDERTNRRFIFSPAGLVYVSLTPITPSRTPRHSSLGFERNYLIHGNVDGEMLLTLHFTLRATYSKNCISLNFRQEYIKSVFSHDLNVISLFQSSLLLSQ
jgi:hypothetical protein